MNLWSRDWVEGRDRTRFSLRPIRAGAWYAHQGYRAAVFAVVSTVSAGPSVLAVEACCLKDGSCVDVADEAACDKLGGVFGGGGRACADTQCPDAATGACCEAAGCVAGQTQLACSDAGGTWQGAGTDCVDPSICGPPDPRGACCSESFEGGCLDDQTEDECLAFEGAVWEGQETTCELIGVCGNKAPVGACCGGTLANGCQDVLTQVDCAKLAGFWAGADTSCSDPGVCQPFETGACCGPTPGSCTDGLTEGDCLGPDGFTWLGPDTSCESDACPPTIPAASTWGIAAFVLALLITGTILIRGE